MPVAGRFNQTLIDTALGYLALGWSVIPLHGDANPIMPKSAAVTWESFQRRRATEVEVASWFERQQFAALGIVCGAVSQLVILDFDEPALLRAFERACPDLLATRTVLTKRGRHLYFAAPPHLAVRSRKLDGIDLLAGGRYAVAPPSVIDGFSYTVGRGGQPKTLSQRDIDRINGFLDEQAQKPLTTRFYAPVTRSPGASAQAQEGLLHTTPESAYAPTSSPSRVSTKLDDLYRGLAARSGRNAALFQVACLARDQGYSYAAVVECLADVHAQQPAPGHHRKESEKARYNEALRTLRSVFKRPARPLKADDLGGLYNSIREKLFQLGQTSVVRVLEGLRLAGFKAGQLVTEKDVLHALRGLVGRHSIRRALLAMTHAGQAIFSPRYPPRRSAATKLRIANTSNANVSISSPNKNRGRPSTAFRIPSTEALCKWLGVKPSASDPLTFEDLQSARKTRQAAHRELIRRRPGTYLRQWLADRLGVAGVTIWRYNQHDDALHVTPTYTATTLGWHNLSAIPAEDAFAAGTFIEDDSGKRWPALKGVATKLLGKGRAVKLLVQSLNYYWCGEGDPLAPGLQVERAVDVRPQAAVVTFAQRVERLVRQIMPAPVTMHAESPPEVTSLPVSRQDPLIGYAKQSLKPAKSRRRRYWKPLDRPDNEALAQRVYVAVNARTSEAKHKLSLVTARKWVDEYGVALLGRALGALQDRRDVRQPVGWLRIWLRSNQ